MTSRNTSIEKAIATLKRLAEPPYEMTALDLSKELKINRSSVHRIINSFIKEMMILQNPITKKYSLGPEAYRIGNSYLLSLNSMDQIRYIVTEVARETNQSVGYSVLSGDKIVNIFEVENFQPIKIGYTPGTVYPINCGAYGKAIMAFYEPWEELIEIVERAFLPKKTPYSITDSNELLKEYEKIRKQGYAISDEEGMIGAMGIGAPIRNSRGQVVASIAAAVVKGTLDERDFEFLKLKIIEGANKISKLIP